MRSRLLSLCAIAALALASLATAAFAQTAPPAGSSDTKPGAFQDFLAAPVHADLTLDLWGLGLTANGEFDGVPVRADVSLREILDHLDGLFLGQAELRKGPLFTLADLTYAKIDLPGKGPLSGDRLPISATFLTLAAGLSSGPMPVGTLGGVPVTVRLEPFAGASYADLDASIDGPSGTLASLSPSWWSPLVGLRTDFARGRSSLRFEGYVSGFSDGRSGQQLLGSYAYRLPWAAMRDPTIGVGYRYSNQKREVDGDSLDLRLKGPVVYVTFHF